MDNTLEIFNKIDQIKYILKEDRKWVELIIESQQSGGTLGEILYNVRAALYIMRNEDYPAYQKTKEVINKFLEYFPDKNGWVW